MKKFNTAEEFLALPEEERIKIAKGIVEHGYDALELIEVDEEREIYRKLQEHYKRIEELAYAIGDTIRDLDQDEVVGDIDSALHEFMFAAADEVEQNYCGDYYSHGDGFWVPSQC